MADDKGQGPVLSKGAPIQDAIKQHHALAMGKTAPTGAGNGGSTPKQGGGGSTRW